MAEDRRHNHHPPEPIVTGSPIEQPLAIDAPQSTAFAEASKLPGYVAWLRLQYQQQLEAAIANMSGSVAPPVYYFPANAQRSPQSSLTTALPTGLETAHLQANVNSPIANQQWMDNGARQVVPLASPEFGCGQNMPYSTEMPAIDSALSPNMDYLMMMVQQSMLNGC